MARIAGVLLPKNKHIVIALTYIYGIGNTRAQKICTQLKLNPEKKVSELTDLEISRLVDITKQYTIEGDLRRKVTMDIKRLQEIGSYRGYRHKRRLPSRGQRTKKNARTRRGRKVTIAGKKKESK